LIGIETINLAQGIIFALLSSCFAVILPRLLSPSGQNIPQGMECYIGMVATISMRGDTPKLVLDGVDYPILSDEVYIE
jgi:hypothetical protein